MRKVLLASMLVLFCISGSGAMADEPIRKPNPAQQEPIDDGGDGEGTDDIVRIGNPK